MIARRTPSDRTSRGTLGADDLVVGMVLLVLFQTLGSARLTAQAESVVNTVHNLSASGPGEIRALDETEVCKFCHIPHNAAVEDPLWGHALSSAQYRVPKPRTDRQFTGSQPDGSSRLCLSCHDGTVALGEVLGEARQITMVSSPRLGPQRRSYLGTDLSGSHPVSFVVHDSQATAQEYSDSDMGLRPLAVINNDSEVNLDPKGRMQCTTCHDPHADRFYKPGVVPRFWVKPTVDEVCLVCHALR